MWWDKITLTVKQHLLARPFKLVPAKRLQCFPAASLTSDNTHSYFVRVIITVLLPSYLTGLDSTKHTCFVESKPVKSDVSSTEAKQLKRNKSNRRPTVQWYFPLTKWVFSVHIGKTHCPRLHNYSWIEFLIKLPAMPKGNNQRLAR